MKLSKKYMILIILAVVIILAIAFWQQILDAFVVGQQAYYKNLYAVSKKHPKAGESRIEVVYFNSPSLNGAWKEFRIYIPKEYDQNPAERFPVLYLLHGDPGNDLDWPVNANLQGQMDKLISEKQIQPMLVVFPDGNGPKIKASMYVNASTADQKMDDYIAKDTINLVESKYRTLNDRKYRAIGGASSGGYGAINLGLRHNDLFGIIIVMGGYFDNWKGILNKILGNNQKALEENSPMQYLPNLKVNPQTHIYLSVGKFDLGSLKQENIDFDKLLTQKGISHEFIIGKGSHTWSEWNRGISQALIYLNSNLQTQPNKSQ